MIGAWENGEPVQRSLDGRNWRVLFRIVVPKLAGPLPCGLTLRHRILTPKPQREVDFISTRTCYDTNISLPDGAGEDPRPIILKASPSGSMITPEIGEP